MPDRDVIVKEGKVKYTGPFDLELLYRKLQEWIKRARFKAPREKRYVERVKPFGKIVDISWDASKEQLDGYLRMELEVKFLIVGLGDIEVDQGGRKIKLQKGDLEITFSSTLVRNAKGEWPDKSVMRRLYERYVVPEKVEFYKIELYKDTEKVMDETKNFLALYRFR